MSVSETDEEREMAQGLADLARVYGTPRQASFNTLDETTNSAGDHYSTLQAFMGVKS